MEIFFCQFLKSSLIFGIIFGGQPVVKITARIIGKTGEINHKISIIRPQIALKLIKNIPIIIIIVRKKAPINREKSLSKKL